MAEDKSSTSGFIPKPLSDIPGASSPNSEPLTASDIPSASPPPAPDNATVSPITGGDRVLNSTTQSPPPPGSLRDRLERSRAARENILKFQKSGRPEPSPSPANNQEDAVASEAAKNRDQQLGPNYNKAIKTDGLGGRTVIYTLEIDSRGKKSSRGAAGDKTLDPAPKHIQTPSEKIVSNQNNSQIVLGRDRPADRLSGYGGSGDTHAASIDIVAGRQGAEARKVDENNEQLWADPDIKKDAARIYISQKTDVDKNFSLAKGTIGHSKAKSGVAIKADGVRIISREGIKLVTRTDSQNSQGGKVRIINGVDIIAGNTDKQLQPMTKGENLRQALIRLTNHVDKLNGIVDALLMSQFELNSALITHFHYSPFFAIPTTPAIDVVVPTGMKVQLELLTKVKRSLVNHKINLSNFKMTYLTRHGRRYINSRFNNVN